MIKKKIALEKNLGKYLNNGKKALKPKEIKKDFMESINLI